MELDAKIIVNYLMKECTNEEYSIINEWLTKDSRNQQWLFELESLWNESKFSDFSEPEYLQEQFKKTLAKIKEPKMEHIKRPLFPAFRKYAAVLALCLTVGTTLFLLRDSVFPDSPNQAYVIETVSNKGDIKEITLPDKSKVFLNNGATLKYAADFNTSERRVVLTGEAYFQVAHDSTKPFRVQTDLFTVKVLGTSFNVQTDKSKAEATLVEGKVVIEDRDNKEILVLSPGQKVETTKASARLQVKDVNTDLKTAWIHGYIAFENATVPEIIDKLEAIYSRKIYIEPTHNIGNTYTGSVLKEENVEQVLKSLQNTIPFNYKSDGKTIRILNQK